MPLRAILFDHDGTLVDSEPEHHRLWAGVLAPYGFTLTEAQYRAHYAGVPTRANAVDLVTRFAIAESAERLAEAKMAVTRDYLARRAFPLRAGAREAIHAFRRAGLTLAVVTGGTAASVAATMRHNGFEDDFALVVAGDDVPANKPAPDAYLLALARLGFRADECVAIEDTEHGLAAAHAAGVRCIAVPTAYSAHHDFAHADAVVDDLAAMVERVRKLLVTPDDRSR